MRQRDVRSIAQDEEAAYAAVADEDEESAFSESGELTDHAELPPVDLDADTFGMSVCSITRDSYFLAEQGFTGNRVLRLATSLFLVLLTIIVQIWLLHQVKAFVCARAVHDIRIDYDKFEVAIYGVENCTTTVNGKHRGLPGTLPSMDVMHARLNTLSSSEQDNVCRIPLSQPYFFGLILTIWTLTCVHELRKAFNLQQTILMLPRIDSMAYAINDDDDDSDDLGKVISGMTLFLKVALTLLTFVPRVGVCLYLLYVGCRWLLATNNFGDLILNAVALEFILCLKETLYNALMPYRNQFDLGVTKIMPYPKHLHSSSWNFTSTVGLLFVSVSWVVLYMGSPHHTGLQQVLPGYNWDVHTVCEQFIKERFAV